MPPGTGSGSRLNVLILGASGMLGSQLLRSLSANSGIRVAGTVRNLDALPSVFVDRYRDHLVPGVDVTQAAARRACIDEADVVINAIGVIKQSSGLADKASSVRLNALLPHEVAEECSRHGARFIHVSTDCVFSGRRGGYSEEDTPDPIDFYGRSKLLGEVDGPSLTLRTSIIGHELLRHASLVDWFLTQSPGRVHGYTNAWYSGVTTNEFARFISNVVLPRPELAGLWHLAADPINKYDLLSLVAEQYGWRGELKPHPDFECDRTMRADRLDGEVGYRPPSWKEMIESMHAERPEWAVQTQEDRE